MLPKEKKMTPSSTNPVGVNGTQCAWWLRFTNQTWKVLCELWKHQIANFKLFGINLLFRVLQEVAHQQIVCANRKCRLFDKTLGRFIRPGCSTRMSIDPTSPSSYFGRQILSSPACSVNFLACANNPLQLTSVGSFQRRQHW